MSEDLDLQDLTFEAFDASTKLVMFKIHKYKASCEHVNDLAFSVFSHLGSEHLSQTLIKSTLRKQVYFYTASMQVIFTDLIFPFSYEDSGGAAADAAEELLQTILKYYNLKDIHKTSRSMFLKDRPIGFKYAYSGFSSVLKDYVLFKSYQCKKHVKKPNSVFLIDGVSESDANFTYRALKANAARKQHGWKTLMRQTYYQEAICLAQEVLTRNPELKTEETQQKLLNLKSLSDTEYFASRTREKNSVRDVIQLPEIDS